MPPGPKLNPANLSPLGRALLAAGAAKGLASLRSIAIAAGLDPPHLHKIATGAKSPTLATLRRLATAVGVELGELVATISE